MRYSGDLSMKKLLNEYIESDKFELGKAGYIKEDGTFIFMEEYHGEDDSLYQFKYPEFSNTHPEEDTCVRIFNEPNEIQYKKLEEIIDLYLDNEEYCKIEIWNKGKYNFYKVFSLREGACEDYQWDENVGNWTGYKLVNIIKNYFHNLNEKLEKTDSGFFITENVYEAKNKILSYKNEGLRIFIDESIPVYFIGTMYDTTHLDMIKESEEYGYDTHYDAYDENQICLLYDPSGGDDSYFADDAVSDNYFTRYCYPDFDIWSELDKDFTKFQLSKILGKIDGIFDYIENLEESNQLNEQLLLELNRGQLINKSKASDNYKDTSKGRNRWERRNKSKIATRVDQYNKIDMNSFFKNDELKVGINVHGETSDYIVAIRYNGVLKEIAEQIKRNNNKLEFKCILIALQRVFNQGNVFVSCSCADWKYRQAYHATRGGYNSGTPEIRASDITNPRDSKGAGCKHVNLVLGNIDWIMKIASVINNYIHYMEDHFERKYADLIFPKLYGMPYQKAIQLNLFDTDDNLSDDEDEIKLSNRYGRERTKFRSDRQVNNMRNFNKQNSINNTNKPTLDLNMNKVKDEIKTNIRTNNISQEEQNKKED